MPSMTWWAPSPLQLQSQRIFQTCTRGEGVPVAGKVLAEGGVVFLFPYGGFGPPERAAVRDDQTGVSAAAVRDDRGPAHGRFRAGWFPPLAVVAVAGQRPADGDEPTAPLWRQASWTGFTGGIPTTGRAR